jgi:LPXTG-motif cell wall-anchored protein
MRGVAAALALVVPMLVLVATTEVASAAPCSIESGYEGGISIGTNAVNGTVTPGQTITVNGTGFPPGCDVVILVNGSSVATVTTDAAGSFSTGVTLGSSISGTVTIGAQAGSFVRTVTLTVATGATPTSAPPTTVAPTPLPRTGSDSTMRLTGMGLALVAAGGLALVTARRRTRATVTV